MDASRHQAELDRENLHFVLSSAVAEAITSANYDRKHVLPLIQNALAENDALPDHDSSKNDPVLADLQEVMRRLANLEQSSHSLRLRYCVHNYVGF